MSIANSVANIPPGKIGPIKQVNDNVYTAEAVSPTGEKFYLAMEPLVGGEKWKRYKDTASYLTYGGNERLGTIGSIIEIGSRVNNEIELQNFLSSRSYPNFWTSDTSKFNQLRDNLRKRKISEGSATAKVLSVIPHASCGINVSQQTYIVYASKSQVSGRISFIKSPDKNGFGGLVEKYGDVIMCVGVRISDIVENRGIFRNPLSIVEGSYGGISMMLHSFTCLTVQENYPSMKTFMVRPLKKMGEIFLKSLPKEKITVDGVPGDKYDKGFEIERVILVPIDILAGLHKAG